MTVKGSQFDVTSADDGVDQGRITEVTLSSGSHVRACPLLLSGARWLVTLSDGAAHVFNCGSGRLLHVLRCEQPQHVRDDRDDIVSVCHDPNNERQVITCSAVGTLCTWDVPLATVISKRQLSSAVPGCPQGFHHITRSGQLLLLSARASRPPDKSYKTEQHVSDLWRLALADSQSSASLVLRKVSSCDGAHWPVSTCFQDRMVAAITGRRRHNITVCALPGENGDHPLPEDVSLRRQALVLRGDQQRPFTCLAGHPSEPCLAVGDSSGRVLLWRDLMLVSDGGREAAPVHSPPCCVLHWHTLAVRGVAFSSGDGGAHLLSGGGECVLVVWPLRRDGVRPRFLPRLGMPICHVTVPPSCHARDSDLVAVVAHRDNVLRVLDVDNGWVKQVVRRLVLSDRWHERDPLCRGAGLVMCGRPRALVANAAVGQLQFVSPVRHHHEQQSSEAALLDDCVELFSLDVTNANYVSEERRQDKSARLSDVTHVAICDQAGWMVTMEAVCGGSRGDHNEHGDACCDDRLKFWQWKPAVQQFVLNSCVDEPHDCRVNAVAVACTSLQLLHDGCLTATAGDDGRVRVWQPVSLASSNESQENVVSWSCCASLHHRGLPASCTSVSPGGACIAGAFGSAAVVWRLARSPGTQLSHSRLAVLNVADSPPLLQVQLSSAEADERVMLVARTANCVLVWSVRDSVLLARLNVACSVMLVQPRTGLLAVFSYPSSSSPRATLHLWHLSSLSLLCCHVLSRAASCHVLAACFDCEASSDGSVDHCRLFYLTAHQMSLQSITISARDATAVMKQGMTSSLESRDFPDDEHVQQGATPFAALVAQKRHSDAHVHQHIDDAVTSRDDVTGAGLLTVLDSASHTVPSLHALCQSFTEHLLPANTNHDQDSQEHQDQQGKEGLSTPPCSVHPSLSHTTPSSSTKPPAQLSSKTTTQLLDKLSRVDFSFVLG